jgi:hypothetical protein
MAAAAAGVQKERGDSIRFALHCTALRLRGAHATAHSSSSYRRRRIIFRPWSSENVALPPCK